MAAPPLGVEHLSRLAQRVCGAEWQVPFAQVQTAEKASMKGKTDESADAVRASAELQTLYKQARDIARRLRKEANRARYHRQYTRRGA